MKKPTTKEKKQLTNSEIASFCNQIALLFQAGFTPVDSLSILHNDMKSASGKELLNEILEVCREGEPFSDALKATKVFPDYVLHLIAIGEESGNLDTCMLDLAAYYEKEDSIAESIKNAVTYPFIMISMMVAVILVLISRVMPIFNQVFIELGSEMTGFSASLLQLGENLNRYSIILIVVMVILVLLYFLATRTSFGKQLIKRFLTTFPLTKGFYDSLACERFANGMALTLHSGMDTFTSLDMVSNLVGTKVMQDKIVACKQSLQDGETLAEALTGAGIIYIPR